MIFREFEGIEKLSLASGITGDVEENTEGLAEIQRIFIVSGLVWEGRFVDHENGRVRWSGTGIGVRWSAEIQYRITSNRTPGDVLEVFYFLLANKHTMCRLGTWSSLRQSRTAIWCRRLAPWPNSRASIVCPWKRRKSRKNRRRSSGWGRMGVESDAAFHHCCHRISL